MIAPSTVRVLAIIDNGSVSSEQDTQESENGKEVATITGITRFETAPK